jgi:hypothetical protein
MKKNLLLLLLATSCWQCKSGDDATPAPVPVAQSKTALLKGKNWKLTAATVNPAFDYFGGGSQTTNIYAGLAPCVVDDVYRYDTPDVFTITDGATSCPGNTQAGTFKWKLGADESTLTQVFGGSYADNVFTLESVSTDKLVLTKARTYSSTDYKFRYEYTKQ